MHGARLCGIAAQEQDRAQEGALAAVAARRFESLRIARDPFGLAFEIGDAREHFVALREARERPHADARDARVADDGLGKLRRERRDDLALHRLRHQRLADRRALLTGLHGHLARDFLDEERELGRSGPGIRAKNGGIERIRLRDETHAVPHDRRVRAKLRRRRGRPGEGNDVLAAEVVEQVADAAADELQRTGRQDSGLDDAPHDELRQVARGGRGLHDRRHAGEQCRREFFKHSPDREVEGIDVHGGALERHADVLADEGSAPGEPLERAVEVDAAVREFARTLAREHQHRADAAVDVDPGVALRRAGAVRELVELRLEVEQALAERAQDGGAFVEGQRAQGRPADLARVARAPPAKSRPSLADSATTAPVLASRSRLARPSPLCHAPAR